MQDCVIENTDASSQFPYVTTFRRSGGNASEEDMRVSKKYRQFFENVESVPRRLDKIRRGRTV